MEIVAFILAIVAGALFLAQAAQSRNFVALGLAVLTAAWICQLVIVGGSHVIAH